MMEFDLTKTAKKAIQNVINNTLYKGKSIKDWIDFIANNADDLISRQAAIKSLNQFRIESMLKHEDVSKIWECEDAIMQCPSVQPEQKTGRWELAIGYDPKRRVMCDQCRKMAYEPSKYCPNCGAKMESEKK